MNSAIGRIEAGFPRVSAGRCGGHPADAEGADLRREFWGFSRAVKADVDELVRLDLQLHRSLKHPTSEIKLKAYGITRDEASSGAFESAIASGKKNGDHVAFFAVDGTRTELDFLKTDLSLGAGGRREGNRGGGYDRRLRTGSGGVSGKLVAGMDWRSADALAWA